MLIRCFHFIFAGSTKQLDEYNHDDSSSSDEEDPSINLMSSSFRGPYFDTTASKNVTALVGKTAYLNCRVRNLGNRTVSQTFRIEIGCNAFSPDSWPNPYL